MLATHTIDPENLYTISAGGFSATADAFARDDKTESLWFVSMVGSQTALKAIWASLLKQPPDVAHIIKGADGMALSGGYQRCQVPYETIGTWTTKIARLRGTGGWHALVYTKTAEFSYEKDSFPAAGAERRGCPGAAPPLPGQAQPAATAPLLGRVALAQGPRRGRDSPAPERGHLRLQGAPKAKKLGEDLSRRWRRAGSPCRRRGAMDRTLKRGKRNNKRRGQRNGGAWRRFSPDGVHPAATASTTGHNTSMSSAASLTSSGPRRRRSGATPRSCSTGTICRRAARCLVRRITVANRAELITAYCVTCAESMGTPQVLCFQRNLAIGEVVGLTEERTTGTSESPPEGGGKETKQ